MKAIIFTNGGTGCHPAVISSCAVKMVEIYKCCDFSKSECSQLPIRPQQAAVLELEPILEPGFKRARTAIVREGCHSGYRKS